MAPSRRTYGNTPSAKPSPSLGRAQAEVDATAVATPGGASQFSELAEGYGRQALETDHSLFTGHCMFTFCVLYTVEN